MRPPRGESGHETGSGSETGSRHGGIVRGGRSPPSSVPGSSTEAVFLNETDRKVKVYRVDYGGGLKLYGELDPGGTRRQDTFSGARWLMTAEKDKPLGYFRTTRKVGNALIPRRWHATGIQRRRPPSITGSDPLVALRNAPLAEGCPIGFGCSSTRGTCVPAAKLPLTELVGPKCQPRPSSQRTRTTPRQLGSTERLVATARSCSATRDTQSRSTRVA